MDVTTSCTKSDVPALKLYEYVADYYRLIFFLTHASGQKKLTKRIKFTVKHLLR